jgi:hypothetical protein
MLSEQVKHWLETPALTPVEQGVERYPRVIRQEPYGENHMLVTFALPGLKRQRMLVPLEKWVAGEHLDTHPATVRHMGLLLP